MPAEKHKTLQACSHPDAPQQQGSEGCPDSGRLCGFPDMLNMEGGRDRPAYATSETLALC